MKQCWVYIMTNKRHNVLYVGVTSNLRRRAFQHKTGYYKWSFTDQYQCHKLVWYQEFGSILEAMA